LESLFKFYDKDGSGALGKSEVSELLEQYGLEEEQATLYEFLFDGDGDSNVSLEEFKKFIRQDGKFDLANCGKRVEVLTSVVERFKAFDTDGSNTIDWSEFQNIMTEMGVTDDNQKAQWWWFANKNVDQAISFTEFYEAFFKTQLQQQYPDAFKEEAKEE